jgi:hypothetical protein
MWKRALGTLVVLPIVLAGCGDSDSADSDHPSDEASIVCTGHPGAPAATIDLDGDGAGDAIRIDAAPLDGNCRDAVVADVGDKEVVAPLEYGLPVESGGLVGIRVPGRIGELLLITAHHPRGGFQAVLYGFSDGRLEELTVGNSGIFPFIATDATTDPISATCTGNGFEVTTARAHQPIGVVPAWDVFRTAYTVDGNTVTKGAPSKVADNVLDKELHRTYRPLTRYSLFANCRVDR